MTARPRASNPLVEHTGPLRRRVEEMAGLESGDAVDLAIGAIAALDRYEAELLAAGIPEHVADTARYGLSVLFDTVARRIPGLSLATWGAVAGNRLSGGEEISAERLEALTGRARSAGPDFAMLADHLADCLSQVQSLRGLQDRWRAPAVGRAAIVALGLVCAALIGAVVASAVRQRQSIAVAKELYAQEVALARNNAGAFGALLDRLDQDARTSVADVSGTLLAPLRKPLPMAVAASHALTGALTQDGGTYLAAMLEAALARDGQPAQNYAHLRIWAMATGASPWNVGFVKQWLDEEGERSETFRRLARFLGQMHAPPPFFVVADQALLDQARYLAQQTSFADRQWVEFKALPEVVSLPGWQASAEIPALASVARRGSGQSFSDPIPGLYTTAGWKLGAGSPRDDAALAARVASSELDLPIPDTNNDGYDLLLRLQRETIAVWSSFLDDVSLRQLRDERQAIEVLATLGRSDSPLRGLSLAAWTESGAGDPRRVYDASLLATIAFGPLKSYADTGGFDELAQIFGRLSVALARQNAEGSVSFDTLMEHRERALSVAALERAPPVVERIVEDLLAQTAQALTEGRGDIVAQRWRDILYRTCQQTLEVQYPLGYRDDLGSAATVAVLNPDGPLMRYLARDLWPLLARDQEIWAWKPEGRLRGYGDESAQFFQKIERLAALVASEPQTVRFDLYGESGGPIEVTLGGVTQRLSGTTPEIAFLWPGNHPESGFLLQFEGANGQSLSEQGSWGLARLVSRQNIRPRGDGQSYFVDIRDPPARMMAEMRFENSLNPVAVARSLSGLRCPDAL